MKGGSRQKIPKFGDWDQVNDMPITQYFESAREAGLLVRHSASSDNPQLSYHPSPDSSSQSQSQSQSQSVPQHQHQHRSKYEPKTRSIQQGKGRSGGINNGNKEGSRKQVSIAAAKVFDDLTMTKNHNNKFYPPPSVPTKRHSYDVSTLNSYHQQQQQHHQQYKVGFGGDHHPRPPKAVDEDLYKIPPELLKRKRRLGFFSKCLVPPCAV